jgi:lytic murein transglycosylase
LARVAPLAPIGRRDVFCSPGQIIRTLMLFGLFCAGLMIATTVSARSQEAPPVSDGQFRTFVTALWPDARQAGVSRKTFDAALGNLTPDPAVIKITGKQSEFVKPIWHYINGAVSAQRLERGEARAKEFERTLARIESKYGVDRYVVLAVWGMETNYGGFSGKMSTVRSLATLAASGYRGTFFRNELIAALQILEQGHIEPENMLGSWAGAMGQTQFMPSSFMKYAVDWDGDGHKNIWTSAQDALASTANYLAEHSWVRDWTWGYEVLLPKGFSLRTYEPNQMRPFTEWAHAGIKIADGAAMPKTGEAALLLPAGKNGPAFLVTKNFQAIKAYNTSTSYALGVALLSDRLAGGNGLVGKWPVNERMPDAEQSLELQKHLVRLGYEIGALDGKIGEKAQAAIRDYQRKAGLEPDGFVNLALLERIRRAP